MPRANTIKRFLPIGVHAQIFRKHWVRSRAMKPFLIRGHKLNTPIVLVVLSLWGMAACHSESQKTSQPTMAVRLATVTAAKTSGDTLRYSASILHYAQVDI